MKATEKVWAVHKPLTSKVIKTLAYAAAELYNDFGQRTPELRGALLVYFNGEQEEEPKQ